MKNDEKIDILISHAVETNARLDRIDNNLSIHMKRSESAERVAAATEERLELIEDEVRPLLNHFQGVKWSFSALVALTAILKLLEYLKH